MFVIYYIQITKSQDNLRHYYSFAVFHKIAAFTPFSLVFYTFYTLYNTKYSNFDHKNFYFWVNSAIITFEMSQFIRIIIYRNIGV